MRYTLSSFVDSRTVPHWAVCLLVGVLAAPASCADADAAVQKRVEALVRLLGSENFDEREQAAQALINIGQPALELLRQALTSQDPEVVKRAKACLVSVEQDQQVLVIAKELKDSASEARLDAAHRLGRLGRNAHRAVPMLIAAIDDSDQNVRCAVIAALGEIGPAASDAVPKLIQVSQNKSTPEDVRWVAIVFGLGELGPRAKQAIPLLLEMLKTENVRMQNAAVNALGKLGAKDERVIAALINALHHEDLRVHGRAAWALGNLHESPEIVIPVFVQFLKQGVAASKIGTREQDIMFALWKFGQDGSPAVSVLVDIAGNAKEKRASRRAAIMALGNIGPKAKDAVPTLRAVIAADRIEAHQLMADEALEKIDGMSK